MADEAAAAAAAAAAAPPGDDWRKSVLQSYRNTEVKEIAKVLAALEGSASVNPTSKLMLASRFEDSIFKVAGSLADYRKKIAKRLKKLQKNYVRPTAPTNAADANASGSGRDNTEAKEELRIKLRREYGDELRYISKNAAAAVEDLKRKLGAEKANQLQLHTDSCQNWALDLGILTPEELATIRGSSNSSSSSSSNNGESGTATATTTTPTPQRPASLSLSQLQKIELHLQRRVGNIRSYVVKHADPDRFLQETLQAKDLTFSKNPAAGTLLAELLKRRMISSQKEQLQKQAGSSSASGSAGGSSVMAAPDHSDDPLLALQTALEKAQAAVPPPTRQDSRQLDGSLRHLDKMRAASTAMMTYWTLPAEQRVTTAPRETLKKIHEVVKEGTDFVLEAVKELERLKQQSQRGNGGGGGGDGGDKDATNDGNPAVSLHDAWSKTLELPSAAAPIAVDTTTEPNGSQKRPRTSSYKPYYRSRMLFRTNRKTPQPLLAAIRRKGALLRMADSNDANAVHLVLDFDRAFTMTIYFSPLSVALRAKTEDDGGGGGEEEGSDNDNDNDNDNNNNNNDDSTTAVSWKPLSHGLTPWGSTFDSGDFRRRRQDRQERELSVWGVTGSYENIGRVVEERLRDASTHATFVLRKCFRNHVKDKTVGFEVELLEGSALLEFLQVARSTYMPHWEDRDF